MTTTSTATAQTLPKAPTGIAGLDELTDGGLPRGRPTLVAGNAGCGKTLLGMEFLVRGAVQHGEPGVFMAFEENDAELARNFAALGFDLPALVADGQLVIHHVRVERSALEAGEYDLEGLFVRVGHAIDRIGARRVVLDTIEALFGGFSDTAILRAELQRLFGWLKDKGVSAIVTAERGGGSLTRHGLEEYVADCVILLDHRVEGLSATRRLRIVKYRGSTHGTNEYPFLIDAGGISIVPVSSLGLKHEVGNERVSTGIAALDAMMGAQGYYRGSSVLISGNAGAGKSSMAASFAQASAARGERCLWLAFEESASQIVRNMRSIGVDLAPAIERGTLRIHAERPTMFGLEMHLVTIHKLVHEFGPCAVIVDPVSNFESLGNAAEIKVMLMRLIDFLKTQQITGLFTSLTTGSADLESTVVGVSSLMDTWILLRVVQEAAERNRLLQVLKSRGMAHSNQVREFVLGERGVELRDVYVGPAGGLVIGSARDALEAHERAESAARDDELESRNRELERKRQALEERIATLRAEFDREQAEVRQAAMQHGAREQLFVEDRERMARLRGAGAAPPQPLQDSA